MTITAINVITGEVTATDADAPSFEPTLAEQRAATFLPKSDFCTNLMGAGILPPADAAEASRGKWPVTFDAVISSLPEAEAAAYQITWAGATTISRMHPLIALLAAHAGLTDAQVDALFGIGGAA